MSVSALPEPPPARRPLWPVALTAVLGVLLTLAAFSMVRTASHERLAAHFERACASLGLTADQRLKSHLDVLYSLRDDFDTDGELSRRAFRSFASAQLRRHTGIRALEWVPVVKDAERGAFEAAARRDGLAGFTLTDLNARGELVPAPRRPVSCRCSTGRRPRVPRRGS